MPSFFQPLDAAKRLRRAADWGRFAAACAAFATGRDVDIAIRSATNAVENNFLTTSPFQQELDSEEEAAEDPEPEAVRKNQRLSAEEIKKRFGESIRHYRDVMAFEHDKEECLQNWIEDVFTESPPSPVQLLELKKHGAIIMIKFDRQEWA